MTEQEKIKEYEELLSDLLKAYVYMYGYEYNGNECDKSLVDKVRLALSSVKTENH